MTAVDYTVNKLVKRHPLQRMDSPSRTVSAAIHALGLASFSYSYNYLISHPNQINSAFGWHFQYLTIIGLTLATITFTLGLLADLTMSSRLFMAKNILSVCSAPMEVLVSVLYWGLRAIDPALVVPKELELPLPPDLSFHAAPSILMMIDLLLLSPPWTITALPAFGLSIVIAFVYWFWIELCFANNGFYPYPIFALLDTTQRIGLFAASAAIMSVNTMILKDAYGRINGFGIPPRDRAGKIHKANKKT